MNYLSKSELLACQARGVIPGPRESEKEFIKRKIKLLPNGNDQKIFSFNPDWVEITYSSSGLLPWQGGCTWIEGNCLTLQIRKRVWGYDRQEIIAHELVHAVRMAYDEPIFEEILAYRTSKSRLRKYVGPLFRSSSESLFVVLALALLSCVNLLYILPFLTTTLSLLLFSYFAIRLYKNQKVFSKTLSRFLSYGQEHAMQILMHLTDAEILQFSKMTLNEIKEYGRGQSCLRWRSIAVLLSL